LCDTMVFAKQPKKTLRTIIRELVERTNTDTARIRVLEQEKDIMKSRADSVEQTLIRQKKQTDKAFSELENKTEKMDRRVVQIETTLKDIIKEIKKLATTSNIKKLENLVDIYNPLKSQFITREEAERLIETKLEKNKQ